MRAVPAQRLDLHLVEIEKRLSPYGDLHVSDEGRDGPRRRVRFRIESPGYGMPAEALFEYTEWYDRSAQGWRLTAYVYEYRPQPPPSRLAHHLHDPHGAHRHCVDADRTTDPDHFEGYPVVLEQAHEEYAALMARHAPIRCRGLRPLRARRGSVRAYFDGYRRVPDTDDDDFKAVERAGVKSLRRSDPR